MAERFSAVSLQHDKPGRKAAVGVIVSVIGLALFLFATIIGGMPLGMIVVIVGSLAVPKTVQVLALERAEKNVALEAEHGVLRAPGLDLTFPELRAGIESVTAGTVVLDLADGTALRLQFPAGTDKGAQLLHALGLGADQRTATVPLRRTIGRFTIGLLSFIGAMMACFTSLALLLRSPGIAIFGSLAFAIATTMLVLRRFGSPHVVIGKDGISVRGMLHEGFYRYADIARTSFGAGEWSQDAQLNAHSFIHLELKNGGRVELPIIAIDRERAQGLLDRLEKARIASTEGRTYLADSLRQAGQTPANWQVSLTRLAHREPGFRQAAVDPAEVERILNDPTADADARVGAAFVLTRIDAGEAQKVRVAVETTADEDLREALLAASRGELVVRRA